MQCWYAVTYGTYDRKSREFSALELFYFQFYVGNMMILSTGFMTLSPGKEEF